MFKWFRKCDGKYIWHCYHTKPTKVPNNIHCKEDLLVDGVEFWCCRCNLEHGTAPVRRYQDI